MLVAELFLHRPFQSTSLFAALGLGWVSVILGMRCGETDEGSQVSTVQYVKVGRVAILVGSEKLLAG